MTKRDSSFDFAALRSVLQAHPGRWFSASELRHETVAFVSPRGVPKCLVRRWLQGTDVRIRPAADAPRVRYSMRPRGVDAPEDLLGADNYEPTPRADLDSRRITRGDRRGNPNN
jgi:hypothetical protein